MNLATEVDRLLALAGHGGFVPVGELEAGSPDPKDREALSRALEERGVLVAVPSSKDAALCHEPTIADLAAACAALSDLPIADRLRRALSDPTSLLGALFPIRAVTAAGFREVHLLDVRAGLAAVEVVPELAHWRRLGEPVAGDVRITQWRTVPGSHRVKSRVVSEWIPMASVPAPSPAGDIVVEGAGVSVRLPLDRAWKQLPRLALAWRRRLAMRLLTSESIAPEDIVLPLVGPLWAVLAEPVT